VTRTGNTERVAKKIYENLGGDIELITEPVNRKGIIGWMRSGGQNSRREAADINPTQYDPSDYDLVVLASPVWAGAVSAPMRGYMTQNAGKLVNTAIFLSNDSGDVEEAFAEIRRLLPNWPLVEGALQRSKIKGKFDTTVSAFIDGISSKTSS
jgi:multimeric flavodoxin WrbA